MYERKAIGLVEQTPSTRSVLFGIGPSTRSIEIDLVRLYFVRCISKSLRADNRLELCNPSRALKPTSHHKRRPKSSSLEPAKPKLRRISTDNCSSNERSQLHKKKFTYLEVLGNEEFRDY